MISEMSKFKEITAGTLRVHREAKDINQDEIAQMLGITQTAVSKIESGNRALSTTEKAVLDWYFFGTMPPRLSNPIELQGALEFSPEEWAIIGALAARAGQTHQQWIRSAVLNIVYGASSTALHKQRTKLPLKAHILAAAGSPLVADVIDWEGEDATILVKAVGLSMSPLISDGEIITMKLKKASRSPYMKKGLIYLIEYDGGYTIKRYNTRPATPDELAEEWSENGKVKQLESLNPDFPPIIIKQDIEWVAWLPEKP
jgi:transcriptional regulator with XRE-family HTH domain